MIKDEKIEASVWDILCEAHDEGILFPFPDIYILKNSWRQLAKVLYNQVENKLWEGLGGRV